MKRIRQSSQKNMNYKITKKTGQKKWRFKSVAYVVMCLLKCRFEDKYEIGIRF
jgi:hypothetical protein